MGVDIDKMCKHLREIAKANGTFEARLCRFCPDRGFCNSCYDEHEKKHEAAGPREVD